LRDKAYAKDPKKINGMSVIGKYLSKMKLRQWNKYGWEDSERLQQEQAQRVADMQQFNEEEFDKVKEDFNQGKIS